MISWNDDRCRPGEHLDEARSYLKLPTSPRATLRQVQLLLVPLCALKQTPTVSVVRDVISRSLKPISARMFKRSSRPLMN